MGKTLAKNQIGEHYVSMTFIQTSYIFVHSPFHKYSLKCYSLAPVSERVFAKKTKISRVIAESR